MDFLSSKLRSKSIKFSGAITFNLFVSTYAYVSYYLNDNMNSFIRVAGTTLLYTLIALGTEKLSGVKSIFGQLSHVFTIDLQDADKMELIRRYLESAVSQWNRLWNIYRKIVKGEKVSKLANLKEFLTRIPRGNISPSEAAFIWTQLAYQISIAEKLLSIPTPFDFLIMAGFLLLLLLMSGIMGGITDIMVDIFESLKFKSVQDLKYKLNLIEGLIINTCKYYNLLVLKNENNKK